MKNIHKKILRKYDPALIKEINSSIAKMYQNLDQRSNKQDLINSYIKESVDTYKNNIITAIFVSTPLDYLYKYKQGIQVKRLKDLDFYNLNDIYNDSMENGYFNRAKTLINSIYDELFNKIIVKFDVNKKPVDHTRIIKNIYLLLHYDEVNHEINKTIDFYDANNLSNLDYITKKYTNKILWFFCGKHKKEYILDQLDRINDIYSIFLDEAKKSLNKYNYIKEADKETVWCNFEARSVDYYSIIEKFYDETFEDNDFILNDYLDSSGFTKIFPLNNKIIHLEKPNNKVSLEDNDAIIDNRINYYFEDTQVTDEYLEEINNLVFEEISSQVLDLTGLKTTLRKYQENGVKFILHNKRVLLGDEMGLGKTVEAIATIVDLYNTGSQYFLIVCPANVLYNWQREVERFTDINVYLGIAKKFYSTFNNWVKNGGIFIISYSMLERFDQADMSFIDFLVADEAHYVKNKETLRTERIERISRCVPRVLLMTGTALENKEDEMIHLMGILNKNLPKVLYRCVKNPRKFRKSIMNVYFRRKRSDVIKELPELTIKNEWCELNDEEMSKYKASVFSESIHKIRQVSWNLDDLSHSSKFSRLEDIIYDASNENRKVLVFSNYLNTISAIQNELGDRVVGVINGSVPSNRRQEIIDKFNLSPAGSVLLLQIVAGGIGANIQSASVVVICEPQFKPSLESQAISRAYRMGQVRNVLVFRLLCINTIDERIDELLNYKQEIFDEYADKSFAADRVKEIDNQGIVEMINLEKERMSNTSQQNF